MQKLSISVILALTLLALAAPAALAHEVPNNTAWHTHDDGGGGHHKGKIWFPTLFALAGLGTYGDASSGGYVDCPNATDKGLLPSDDTDQSPVLAAGVCMNDLYVIHLRNGLPVPTGWTQVPGTSFWFKVTPRG